MLRLLIILIQKKLIIGFANCSSFSQFAKEISNKQKNSILEFSEMGKPILGICLGLNFYFQKF